MCKKHFFRTSSPKYFCPYTSSLMSFLLLKKHFVTSLSCYKQAPSIYSCCKLWLYDCMLYTNPQYLVLLLFVLLWLQLLKAEDDIQCLKNDNSHMNQASQASSQEIGQLQDQLHQIELELTISQEKHRTCQKEVRLHRQMHSYPPLRHCWCSFLWN